MPDADVTVRLSWAPFGEQSFPSKVDIVYGPDDAAYVIDHHHIATALWRAKVIEVPVVRVKDFSALMKAEF